MLRSSIFRTTPFRLGTESPDLVSAEFIDRNRTGVHQNESHQISSEAQNHFETDTKGSNSCMSDTSLGILNFKTSIEGTTPSIFKGRNVANWNKKNAHHITENYDTSMHNQIKINSSSLHQPPFVQQSMPQETHHSSNILIPSLYQSQHNEFTQNDTPSVLNHYSTQSTSDSNTRTSQSYSTSNSHMYL